MDLAPVILGTAGHIDHGKSSLVRALTGIDPDRLAEEQARGITIELGFAHLDVGPQRFGFVDVPGHERFVRAMVAGATGIDVCVLVVAADEGVMPQTREHLAICDLLGLRAGLVALTKSDLAPGDLTELAIADVRAALEGTFLDGAPIVPVSARTGEGLPELTRAIATVARGLPPRSADGPFRLPIDRAFTLKGFGTVVTGTIWGGRVAPGDDVIALPGGPSSKVRGLQVHGAPASGARAGLRAALNLAVPAGGLDRGLVLCHAAAGLGASHLLDARVRLLPGDRPPLGRRAKLLLHHGTAQVGVTVVLADRTELAPGGTALAQLRLERPIVALPGDRFILRGFARAARSGTTIGGGEILRALAPKLRPGRPDSVDAVQRIAAAGGSRGLAERGAEGPLISDERVALEVRTLGPAGLTEDALAARLGAASGPTRQAIQRLVRAGALWTSGGLVVHAEPIAALEADALSALDAFHVAEPLREGVSREELRSRLPRSVAPRLFDALLDALVRRGAIIVDRDLVRRVRAGAPAVAADPLAARLVDHFRTWALEPPRPVDVPAAVGAEPRAVAAALEGLVRAGSLVRVRPDYLVAREVLDALRARLVAHLRAHGAITPPEWKDLVGSSRKYTIPLAEHFDAEKVTLRVGELRRPRNLPPG